jgi:hypothetical protein
VATTYYLGNDFGVKIGKQTFKTLAGAKRARFNILDSGSGVKIFRIDRDGLVERYFGVWDSEEEWFETEKTFAQLQAGK